MADPLPLPPPPNRFAIELTATGKRLDYTADDMRAYAAAARKAALLEAEQLIAAASGGMQQAFSPPGQPGSYARGNYNGLLDALNIVRALRERANG